MTDNLSILQTPFKRKRNHAIFKLFKRIHLKIAFLILKSWKEEKKMKEKMKKVLVRFGPLFLILALEMGVFKSNAAACFGFYQPKEPEGMKKFKKI